MALCLQSFFLLKTNEREGKELNFIHSVGVKSPQLFAEQLSSQLDQILAHFM